MMTRNTIPKPSPAQQRVIDQLRAGHEIVWDRFGWVCKTAGTSGVKQSTVEVLINLALVEINTVDEFGVTARLSLPVVTYERADKDCWRLVHDGEAVGEIRRYPHGMGWTAGLYGTLFDGRLYKSPLDAIKAGQKAFASAIEVAAP